mmetsp:Transcript_8306/g.23909  ORF Transcript_8306/g.23909 Transcript_8306/m.23909 type:complete len:201 (-) Transcript_8306:593-1195(-)
MAFLVVRRLVTIAPCQEVRTCTSTTTQPSWEQPSSLTKGLSRQIQTRSARMFASILRCAGLGGHPWQMKTNTAAAFIGAIITTSSHKRKSGSRTMIIGKSPASKTATARRSPIVFFTTKTFLTMWNASTDGPASEKKEDRSTLKKEQRKTSSKARQHKRPTQTRQKRLRSSSVTTYPSSTMKKCGHSQPLRVFLHLPRSS